MDKDTLYVIAAWGGPRRTKVPEYEEDPAYYLRHHLAQLGRLQHDCEVLVVNNKAKTPIPGYDEFLDTLPAGITLVHRPNVGMSYGAWSFAYGLCRDKFRYYLFMEDDYLPVIDHFDTILRELLEERGLGYLGGLFRPGPLPAHMGYSNGLLKQEALESVWKRWGQLPHAPNSMYGPVEQQGQVALGQAIIREGWKLGDYTDRYSSPYQEVNGEIFLIGSGPFLIVPVPMFTRNGRF